MENQDFGKSYVVLYKIGGLCADEPNLCGGTLKIQSYIVLYKIGDAALPIPLTLSLAIALGGLGVSLPICLLIIGVLGLPFSPAVADHLRVQRISSDLLPMVFGAAAPLALRLAANTLLKPVRRGLKNALAIGAPAGRDQCGSSESRRDQLLRKPEKLASRLDNGAILMEVPRCAADDRSTKFSGWKGDSS